MGGAKTLSIIIAANIKGLETSMAKANKTIGSFASNAARLGSMLTFGVTAPLAAMGKEAMDTFVNFEQSMAKVQAVTGATVQEFAMLTDESERLGASTIFTAQEFSNLQMVLGRKGFKADEIKDMTGAIADLALATGEDLTLASNIVGASIRAFGKDASDAGKIANTLALASANSSIQLSTFSTAFANAGASASSVGVDIEELSAMMGVLMDSGIKASKAGTGLNSLFITLKEKGVSLSDTLDMLSEGQMGLEKATALVGRNFSKQLLILSKNRDKTKELTKEYRNNTDGLQKMADLMSKTTFAKLKKFTSAMEGLRLEFGAVIAETLMPIIESLTELATKFANLDTSTKKIIISVGTFLGILGPGLLTLSLFSAAITTLTASVGLSGTTMMGAYLSTMKFTGGIVAAGTAAFTTGGFVGVLTAAVRGLTIAMASNPLGAIAVGLLAIAGVSLAMGDNVDDATEEIEDLNKELKKGSVLAIDYSKSFGVLMTNMNGYSEHLKEIKKLEAERRKAFEKEKASNNLIELDSVSNVNESSKIIRGASNELKGLLTQLETVERIANSTKDAITNIGIDMAMGFSVGFAELFVRVRDSEGAILSFGEKFNKFALKFLTQIGVMILQAAIFAAILSVIFPAKALGGGLGAAGFQSTFLDLMQGGSGLKKFADGGRPPLNRMSLVGENGPELFNPGSQSGTIIPNHAMGGGSSIPDVRISGNDLLIVFNKAQRRKNLR